MSSSQWLHLCLRPLPHPSSHFLSWSLGSIPWLRCMYLVEVFVLLKIFPKSLALYQQSNHSFIQYFCVNSNSGVNPRSLELELHINNTTNPETDLWSNEVLAPYPSFYGLGEKMVWVWVLLNSVSWPSTIPKRQNLAFLIQLVIDSIVIMINKSQDDGAVGYNENLENIKSWEIFQ